MDFNQDDLNLMAKIIVNSLLLALLWAILVLPASTFSLLKYDGSKEVLSKQDVRYDNPTVKINSSFRGR